MNSKKSLTNPTAEDSGHMTLQKNAKKTEKRNSFKFGVLVFNLFGRVCEETAKILIRNGRSS